MSKLGYLGVAIYKEIVKTHHKNHKEHIPIHRSLFGNSIFDCINYYKPQDEELLAQAYKDIEEWESRPIPLTPEQRFRQLENQLGLSRYK